MNTYQHLLVDVKGQVATITLNRPQARNALSGALAAEIAAAFESADRDPEIRALILTGAGPSFCGGADLNEIAANSLTEARERVTFSLNMNRLFARMSKPTIAAVHGHAVAGGCGLATAMDFVIAASNAKFGYPEATKGLVAALVMVNLSRLVGKRRALDLLITGRFIDAVEAERIGLINRVVPQEQLMPEAQALAQKLAALPPDAVRLTKQLYHRVLDADFDSGLQWAGDINLLMRLSGEAQRGASEFLKKK